MSLALAVVSLFEDLGLILFLDTQTFKELIEFEKNQFGNIFEPTLDKYIVIEKYCKRFYRSLTNDINESKLELTIIINVNIKK